MFTRRGGKGQASRVTHPGGALRCSWNTVARAQSGDAVTGAARSGGRPVLTGNAVQTDDAPTAVPMITCRLCGSAELRSFLDLGATPPCELFLTADAAE